MPTTTQIKAKDLAIGQRFRVERLDRCPNTYCRVRFQGQFTSAEGLVCAFEDDNNIVFFHPEEIVIPVQKVPVYILRPGD